MIAPIATTMFLAYGVWLYITRNKNVMSTRNDEFADEQEARVPAPSPAPYSRFGHPNQFVIDKILSVFFGWIFPLHRLTALSHIFDGRDMANHIKIKRFQSRVLQAEKLLHRFSLFKWKTKEADHLLDGTVTVPRNSRILSEWKIMHEDIDNDGRGDGNGRNNEIKVQLTCATSAIIKNSQELENQLPLTFPCKLETLDLSPTYPILIYFHGGGMVLGGTCDGIFSNLLCDLHHDNASHRPHLEKCGIIVLSVDYRLAPEHPFPAAVIDCLSAVSHIIQSFTNDIHIAGFSAGGNLATVVGLECHRRHFGRIKSVVPMDPMLLPRTDSPSFHLNSMSSTFCPTGFVRWCWATYLRLEAEPSTANKDIKVDFDNIENYQYLLENSKWYKNSNRLVSLFHPTSINIPENLKTPFIVKTSSADPLRHDGLHLVEALKNQGGNVLHIEATGSHGVSIDMDRKARKDFIDLWRTVIW